MLVLLLNFQIVENVRFLNRRKYEETLEKAKKLKCGMFDFGEYLGLFL